MKVLLVSSSQLRKVTSTDPQLSAVLWYIQDGWLNKVAPNLLSYYRQKAELETEAGCMFWRTQVVVPLKLRLQILVELHNSHPGIVRMKGFTRAHVWWLGLSTAIDQTVYNCDACQGNRKQ